MTTPLNYLKTICIHGSIYLFTVQKTCPRNFLNLLLRIIDFNLPTLLSNHESNIKLNQCFSSLSVLCKEIDQKYQTKAKLVAEIFLINFLEHNSPLK